MITIPASEFTIEELTDAYNRTRVDYIVPMPMTAVRLQEYIDTYDIDLTASCTVVDDEEDDHFIIGLGMLGVRGDRAWISRLGVVPYARRLGAGKELMYALIEETVKRQYKHLWLEVIKGNEPAHRLFKRLGFVETRELLVLRRPPGPLPPDVPCIKEGVEVYRLSLAEILDRLHMRRIRPNWLNETESYGHVTANLTGIQVVLPNNAGWGWAAYESNALQLKRLCIEAVEGDEVAVSTAVLYQVHKQAPTKDAVFENLPVDDPRWPAYQALGYFDSFYRIEMVKDMSVHQSIRPESRDGGQ
ncbi:MAG: GNAT family N-acetyltransferase [Anaerolineales bacterium]|nr:GNAT family N-acetyltransferase [Anaerolineales bacterium]